MPISTVLQTLQPGFVYRPVDEHQVTVSSGWAEHGSWLQPRRYDDTWWMSCSVVASVDPGIEGEVQLRASEGDVVSAPARIVSRVGPVLLGWTQVSWPAGTDPAQFIAVEARRLAGSGGGIRVHSAHLLMMTAPPLALRIGPTYPPGYDPGQQAPYPPDYDTAEPYGG